MHSKKYWQQNVLLEKIHKDTKKLLGDYITSNSVVLDIGAGYQPYRSYFEDKSCQYIGLDVTNDRTAQDIVGNALLLPIKNATFDVVFSSQVFEHLPEPWTAFSEVHRVLKDNGIAIISVPHLAYLHNTPHDYYRYTHFGLKYLAESQGFTVKEIVKSGGIFSFINYVRSSMLLPFIRLPLLGTILWTINRLVGKVEIGLDMIFYTESLLPANYLIVVEK